MNGNNKFILLDKAVRPKSRFVNTGTPLQQRPKVRDETSCTRPGALLRSSEWRRAWIDCLVQACMATPWIIVSAIGRLLFPSHA